MTMNGSKPLVLVLCSLLLTACETVSYYQQAASGQISLLLGRKSIDVLLGDSSLSPELQRKLSLVQDARVFARDELFLPVGNSYTQYVEIDRPYVVWNVFAAPEFSSSPMNWCYPIAGCVSYRGFFSEGQAERYVQKLELEGFDVYMGGVDAYSTLGWFNDPLTSSVMRRDDHRLLGLVFHELAHQLLYVPGDTTFNESFASFVEEEGLRRWMLANPEFSAEIDLAREERLQAEFVALVSEYRDRFSQLYNEDISEQEMRREKQILQRSMREGYEQMRVEWGGAYAGWFSGPLNNAQLSTVSSYNDLVPVFALMLEQNDNDLQAFFAEAKAIAKVSQDQREASLARYRPKVLNGLRSL